MIKRVGILLLVTGFGVLVICEATESTDVNESQEALSPDATQPAPDNSSVESPPYLRKLEGDTDLKPADQLPIEHEQPTAEKLTGLPFAAMQVGYSPLHVNEHENQRPSSTEQPAVQSSSVECYVCTDCPEANDSTPRKRCPHTNKGDKDGHCIVYAQKYKNMDRLWYIRGCPQERGSCQEIEEAHLNNQEIVSLHSCAECKGNLCNGAFPAAPSVLFVMLALVVSPVLIKSLLK